MIVNKLIIQVLFLWGLPGGANGKESAYQWRRPKGCVFNPWVRKIHSLEEKMATHSNILAWKIPWTEEPGGLQSMVLQELDMTEQLSYHHHHHDDGDLRYHPQTAGAIVCRTVNSSYPVSLLQSYHLSIKCSNFFPLALCLHRKIFHWE